MRSQNNMVRLAAVTVMCVVGALPLTAQGQTVRFENRARPAGTATITGTVLDAESQHPVRLAQVYLLAKSNDRGGGGGNGRTGLDGRFVVENVVEGDYYVVASAEGYVTAAAQAQAAISAGASADDVLRTLPVAHVNAGGSADVMVSVQRGGAISGHIEWADGLVATGMPVTYEPAQQTNAAASSGVLAGLNGFVVDLRRAMVDDRGSFRLPGLASGDYIVSMSFAASYAGGGTPSMLRMYYPGVFRRSEAKPVTVRLGEDRDDLRMVVDLSALHTVSGTVSAATGSAQVRSGVVSLHDTTDSSLHVFGQIKPDGSFAVNYVPAGTYSMTVSGSSQERSTGFRRGGDDSGTNFAPFTQTISVTSTDVTGLTVSLNPAR